MRAHAWISIGLLLSCVVLTCPATAAQVITVSDFQDKTTDGWQVNRLAQNVAPEVIESGGPQGGDDAFLELTSLGSNGPGSRLAAYNPTEDWIGNYLEQGASAVELDMKNDSGQALEMRLVVFGDGSTSNRWTSSESFPLPSDGQWHRASFSLAEAALVSVGGQSPYTDMLGDVVRVMFRHDDGSPSRGGAPIAAKVGLDNIRLLRAIDFNGDGRLNFEDVDLMLKEIKSGGNSTDFDLNADNLVDRSDLTELVTGPENLNSYIGDADLNGEFGTTDLVAVFSAGEYEDNISMNSTWETGDWNGDAEFGTGDLVAAFEDGGFEQGPRRPAPNVPEPSTGVLLAVILLLLSTRRRFSPSTS